MKHHILFLHAVFGLLTCIAGCTPSQRVSRQNSAEQLTQEISHPSYLLTDSLLPQHIDLQQNIENMSYQELRLLRSYPYALHGYWFTEGELNAFFTRQTDWYYELCDSLCFENELYGTGFPDSYEKVNLTDEEKNFIARIDQRMQEIEKEKNTSSLNNPRLCVNLFQMETPDKDFSEKLTAHNFAIAETDYEQLFQIYEKNDYLMMPNFITTDVYLQATHMYFSYVLKYLEQNQFIPALSRSTEALYEECMHEASVSANGSDLQELAEYNATFFAIATHLLNGKTLEVPERYKEDYETEIANIEAQEDNISLFLGYTDANFPYSLFKPRGHYNRNEASQRYFKSMMWLQTASFCRDDKQQFSRSVFMALAYNHLPDSIRKDLQGVYDALTFLMGEPDNMAVIEIAEKLKESHITHFSDAIDENVLGNLNEWLAEAFKTRNRIKPKIEVTCPDKINLMPQRYLPDNEILSHMADPDPNSNRAYPRGLDVMAAFGSETATHILDTCYHEPDNWSDYSTSADKMKKMFGKGIDRNASMYNGWLCTLIESQKTDKNYPGFMQTPAWQCKTLNTALASWAELKHDAILYGEQPFMAECGDGGCLSIPVVVGYVEPNLKFWRSLKEMLVANREILERNGLLDETLKGKSESLEEKVDFCLHITEKELRGESATSEEYMTIQKMGSSLEWFTLSVIDPENDLDNWSLVQGAERSVAVVADVFTRNVLGCEKNGILHEATGNADVIYVLVNIGGINYLTSGAVLRYYEFTRPLGNRLTDEEWQELLKTDKAPLIPEWMRPLKLKNRPAHNETFLYSTGC